MNNSSVILQVGSRKPVRREKTKQELEEKADGMLGRQEGPVRVYTEKQLERKIKLEDHRMPVVSETQMSKRAEDYLLARQLSLMVQESGLNYFQETVLELTMLGWTVQEIACRIGRSSNAIRWALKKARKKVALAKSRYDGLYEVYWSEVHRYVYRKGR